MMEPKYSLVDATTDEQKSFMLKFQTLLDETGMYYEPVPQFTRDTLQSPWRIVCQVYLAKKVPEEGVISPIQDVIPEATS